MPRKRRAEQTREKKNERIAEAKKKPKKKEEEERAEVWNPEGSGLLQKLRHLRGAIVSVKREVAPIQGWRMATSSQTDDRM